MRVRRASIDHAHNSLHLSLLLFCGFLLRCNVAKRQMLLLPCPRRTGLAQAVGDALVGVITASNYATIKQFPTG